MSFMYSTDYTKSSCSILRFNRVLVQPVHFLIKYSMDGNWLKQQLEERVVVFILFSTSSVDKQRDSIQTQISSFAQFGSVNGSLKVRKGRKRGQKDERKLNKTTRALQVLQETARAQLFLVSFLITVNNGSDVAMYWNGLKVETETDQMWQPGSAHTSHKPSRD